MPEPEPSAAPVARAPAPTDGVEVLGPAAGSGYRTPPVLVRRGDGQILQLTPLLAAVLAAVDGRRDVDAIADHVAEHHGRAVHPDDVATLVARLVPLGLVRRPGEQAVPVRRADPLLGLRGRIQLVGPERTHALTRPFLWLFRPAALVVVLTAFAASAGWVLLHHGLGTAVDEAIADPALLLGVVALVLASGAFHELGHATACRYGGARCGGMGAAVYLVWPAFFTDVTDSYRLDRRGRLRVDLGGLYFNAVFTVVTVVTWLVTGVEGLLVLVPVQLLQMARQLVPIVRFDGYHVLADLVGVPDLFARIRPTLAAALPRSRRAPVASPLTRRAQLVVVAWVAAVVPVLLASMGLLLWNLPGIVTSALRSLRLQAGLFADNVGAGRVAAALLGVVAMATVAFLPASAAYLASRIARRSGVRWWRLTDGRPVLRAAPAAALVLALLVAGPGLVPRPSPAPADLAGSVADGDIAELAAGAVVDADLDRVPRARRLPTPAPPAPAPAPAPAPVLLVEAEPTPEPTPTPAAAAVEAAAPLPVVRPAWPFAFDPPSPPRAGDNQALAVGTVDGATQVAWATSLEWVQDASMLHRNEAWAVAECVGCRTLAVAFQVVAAAGDVPMAVPQNLAVSVNEDCRQCRTAAVAVQVAVTLDQLPPRPVRAQVAQIVARANGLRGTMRDATAEQIRDALGIARAEVLAILEPYVAHPLAPSPEEPAEDLLEPEASETAPDAATGDAEPVPAAGPDLDAPAIPVDAEDPAEDPVEVPAGEPPAADDPTTPADDPALPPDDGQAVAGTGGGSATEESADGDRSGGVAIGDGSSDATVPGSEDPGTSTDPVAGEPA